jgi:hypothetical protein
MDRSRVRSASPLIQLRETAKSSSSLGRTSSGLARETDKYIPRSKKASTSMGNLDMLLPNESNQSFVSLSEDGSDNAAVSSFSIRSQSSHRPRIISKSVDTGNLVSDSQNSLDSAQQSSFSNTSPMVRSKSSFCIHHNALSGSEMKSKSTGSNSSVDLFKHSAFDLHEPKLEAQTSSDKLLDTSDDGFCKDLEMKGFLGIWNNPVARYIFNLMAGYTF